MDEESEKNSLGVAIQAKLVKKHLLLQNIVGLVGIILLLFVIVILLFSKPAITNSTNKLEAMNSQDTKLVEINKSISDLGKAASDSGGLFAEQEKSIANQIKSTQELFKEIDALSKSFPDLQTIDEKIAQLKDFKTDLTSILNELATAKQEQSGRQREVIDELKDQQIAFDSVLTEITKKLASFNQLIEWESSTNRITCVLVGASSLPTQELLTVINSAAAESNSNWGHLLKDYSCKAAYGGDTRIIDSAGDEPPEGLVTKVESLDFQSSPDRYVLVVSGLMEASKIDKLSKDVVIDAVVLVPDNTVSGWGTNFTKWADVCLQHRGNAILVRLPPDKEKLKTDKAKVGDAISTLTAPRVKATRGANIQVPSKNQPDTEKK